MNTACGIVVIVLIFVAIAVGSCYASKKRRQALELIASARGLQFCADDESDLPAHYADTSVCSQGHSRRACNIISGRRGAGSVQYFDYRYTTGSGKNQQTHDMSCCVFAAGFPLARLHLRPETFLDKAAAFIGFEDIDLDNAEFNKRFFVKSDDKKFAYDILNQKAMEFFLERPAISMETSGNRLMFSYDRTVAPDEAGSMIDSAVGFADLIPNFVRERQGN